MLKLRSFGENYFSFTQTFSGAVFLGEIKRITFRVVLCINAKFGVQIDEVTITFNADSLEVKQCDCVGLC